MGALDVRLLIYGVFRVIIWPVRYLFDDLGSDCLCIDDLLENLHGALLWLFLDSEYLSLVDSKEKLCIETINILQDVVVHYILGFAQRHESQEGTLALHFAPLHIRVTA